MKAVVAIIHTTPVTIEPLTEKITSKLPESKIVNFVDDSILPQLKEGEQHKEFVEERIIQYMIYAEQIGANIILNACSSVGEVVSKAQKKIAIPIIRIDEAMAIKAVEKSSTICIAATLETTLKPTEKLLRTKAKEANKEVDFETVVADSAYQLLLKGDNEGHDRELAKTLHEAAINNEVVVLAQASMARVSTKLPKDLQDKFLTSPDLGIEELVSTLKGK